MSTSLRIEESLAEAQVLRAAAHVFADKGVAGTRVEDLLRSAGIARRTFYKRYRSKEDVLAKLYAFVTRALLQGIEDADRAIDDPLAGLRGLLDTYLEFHLTNHRIVRVLAEEAVRSDSPLFALRARFRARLVRALDDACFVLVGRRFDEYVFIALISGLEGMSLELLRGERRPEDVERVRATTLALVEAILRSPDAFPSASPLPAS